MASEEDNFDIDVYGDGGEEYAHEPQPNTELDTANQQMDGSIEEPTSASPKHHEEPPERSQTAAPQNEVGWKIASTAGSAATAVVHLPKQAPQTQGVKRKEGDVDERYVDPNATTALFVSELHWWITDDDIRGWANQSQCEDELEDITFNEHKVNGKSKGQAYVLFKSAQSATAAKQRIQSFGEGQTYAKNFVVSFSSPNNNPFRTLPKDGPTRNNAITNTRGSSNGAMNNYSGGSYRGRGVSYHNRGAGMHNSYNRGGYQGGFLNPGAGNFPQMGSMPSYGGFQGRGGMMGGMRGGGMNLRGGRGGMMGMPMGMGMGSMSMGMGMRMPMGGMAMAGNPGAFNPAIFNQQQPGGSGYGVGVGDNPHGAKRMRQD